VADIDPREYVDREQQQALLRDMLCGRDPARVLVIADASGQGKTDLLLRMRVNCREDETRVPVLLADLRDLSTPFGVVERATKAGANMDVVAQVLAGYVEEYERRTSTSYVQIDQGGASVVNDVSVEGPVAPGAVVAGQYVTAPAPAGVSSWSAQQQCCLAFLRDLEAWDDGPLVLLVDHFNKATPGLREWVDEKLVRPCTRGELGSLVVVLASTPDTAPRYDPGPLVRYSTLDPLDSDPAFVERLLRAHRLLSGDDDPLLPLALDRLRRGVTILDLITACGPLALARS
jgi:hypothetical protein